MASLAQRIVDRGLVTEEQMDAGRVEAVRTNRSLWYALVRLDYVSEEALVRFFAHEAQIPYVHLPDYRIKQSVLRMLDEHFCRQNRVIPLWLVKDTLFVACDNPFDAALMDTIGKLSRCNVEPLIAASTAITRALDSYWKVDESSFAIADYLVSPAPVKGLAAWRCSERILVDWPVSVAVQDEALSKTIPERIEGRTHDLSADAQAIGISLGLYLPKGITVSMRICPTAGRTIEPATFEVNGEIMQSYMNKTQDYSTGIRFTSGQDAIKKSLLDIALSQIKN